MLYILILIITITFLLPSFLGYMRLHKALGVRTTSHIGLEERYKFSRQKVYFTTADGLKIAAWYVHMEDSKATIVLVPGYKGADGGKALMLGHAEYLSQAGYSVLLLDLRATGESEGERITLGIQEWKDIAAAYDYLKTLPETSAQKIGCYGISMGASSCINFMAQTGKGDFLIASVPFWDIKNVLGFTLDSEKKISSKIFKLIMPLVAKLEFGWDYERFVPKNNISKITVPKLFIAAKNDDVVFVEDTHRLYEIAKEPKQIWEANTKHDVFAENPEGFKNNILSFLETI